MLKRLLKTSYFKSLRWGFGIIAVTFIKQILLVPVFLSFLGKDIFAFWLIANSILFVIRSLGLGVFNYSSNTINLQYHLLGKSAISDLIQRTYSSCTIFFLLQLLICIPFFFLDFTAFITQFSQDFLVEINGVLIVSLLLLCKIPSSFVSLFFVRLYEPLGKIDKTLKFQLLLDLLDLIVIVSCVALTKNLFITIVVLFIANILYSLFVMLHINNGLGLKIKWLALDLQNFFYDMKMSAMLTFSFITEKIYDSGLNLIIASAYNPKIVALFGSGRVLSNSALRFSNTVSEPLMPNIQKDFASGVNAKILNTFHKYWQVTCSLAFMFTVFLIPFLEDLFTLWTRNELNYNDKLFRGLFAAMLVQNFMIVLVQLLRRTNLSLSLLIYNFIKVIITVSLFFVFGRKLWYDGLGFSLLIGEIVSGIYIFFYLKKGILMERFRELFFYFLIIVTSSLSIIFIDNFIFLVVIGFMLIVTLNFQRLKRVFNVSV